MLTSIEFDYDAALETNEVENEIVGGMLAAEFAAFNLPSTQALPEQMLSLSRRVAQPTLQLGFENALVRLTFHSNIRCVINTIPTQPSP
jgi:hypothetical protein